MRYLLLVVLSCFTFQLLAVPAYPGKVTVVVDGGKTVTISMKGDEYFKYALSEDGYTLLCEDNVWKYATKDEDGNLVASKFALTTLEGASNELNDFKSQCPKHLTIDTIVSTYRNQRNAQRIGIHTDEPIVGQRHALVVLMQYQDVKLTKTHEEFDALFNEEGFSLDNAKGSVKDFYDFASAGQLDYHSDIYGPYTASNKMRYYGQNSSRGGGDVNAIELCLEAIRNLPKNIDYSLYDNDKDGIVDNIHIIFAGYGEEAGASSDAIWSHEYPYKIIMKSEVGYNFAGYSCTPELRGNTGKKISNIGVICHELGHALGANDYYDTNYAVEGSYDGTGKWDIMASGNWNDDGRLPPNFNPYVRTHDFGWESIVEISDEGSLTLMPHSYESENNVVYQLNTGSENDYFLLENRQQMKFDESLPGKGLLIYHVHPNIETLSATNSINDTNPQGFYPVCASGSKPTSKLYGNINSAECPFPGSQQITSFSPNSSPSAKAWDGSPAYFSISSIKQMYNGSITFNVSKEEHITDDPIIDDDGDMETFFEDSFESGIAAYNTSILMGKKNWACYPNNQIVSNTDMIPSPSDGKKLLMLFTGKTKTICEAEITRKITEVVPEKKYYLSFDVMTTYLPEGLTPVFRFWIKDENMQIYSQTLTNVNGSWEHVEVPFTSNTNSVEYGFYGNVYTGGLFVDNVKIQTYKTPSSISQPSHQAFSIKYGNAHHILFTASESTIVKIYTIGGQLVGKIRVETNKVTDISLEKGIYIVKASDGSSQKLLIN